MILEFLTLTLIYIKRKKNDMINNVEILSTLPIKKVVSEISYIPVNIDHSLDIGYNHTVIWHDDNLIMYMEKYKEN